MWSEILNLAFFTSFLSAAVRMAVPLAFAALGETVSQKAGTLNIGLEANMHDSCSVLYLFAAKPKCDGYRSEPVCSRADQLFLSSYCQSNSRFISTNSNTANHANSHSA